MQVKQMSEDISLFWENYNRMQAELQWVWGVIAEERADLKMQRVYLMEMQNELDTKQKALEMLWSDYIVWNNDVTEQLVSL